MHPNHSQQGAVLIVSLLILLVLTIIGVSGLSNTNLEERMSHNFQTGMLVFQGVESAHENIKVRGTPGSTNYNTTANPDPFLTALNAGRDDTSTVVDQDMDPDNLLGGATLTTSTIISCKGTLTGDLCAGESAGGQTCNLFELTTTGTITENGTNTTHVQGLERIAPNSTSC